MAASATLGDGDHVLPCELIRKIITVVFADCVFTICCSQMQQNGSGASGAGAVVAPLWEMNVAPVLSSVSFAFQEIVREVSVKVFEIISLKEDESVLSVVRGKLTYLRNIATNCRDPTLWLPVEHFSNSSEQPAFVKAYTLWLTCWELRDSTARDPLLPTVFVNTHRTILRALALGRQACRNVHPRGMTVPIMRALAHDEVLVETGLELVQARIDLYEAFDRMEAVEAQTNEEKIYANDSIKAAIHQSLSKYEAADLFNQERQSPFMQDDLYRTYQLPILIDILERCRYLYFDLDEYDIPRRAESLLNSYERFNVQVIS